MAHQEENLIVALHERVADLIESSDTFRHSFLSAAFAALGAEVVLGLVAEYEDEETCGDLDF